MIHITTKKLEAIDACDDGIAAFNEAFPNGLRLPGWTLLCQLIVLAHPKLRRFWGGAL